MADTNSIYWASTEPLEVYMQLTYQKVKKMMDKKISDLKTQAAILETAKTSVSEEVANMKAVINKKVSDTEEYIYARKDEVIDYIQETYNDYHDMYDDLITDIQSRSQSLNEVVCTQDEYDSMIASPGTNITTSRGDIICYVAAVMTASQKLTLESTGEVTTSFEGLEAGPVTWTKVGTNAVSTETTPRTVALANVLGKGAFRTYYIVEE